MSTTDVTTPVYEEVDMFADVKLTPNIRVRRKRKSAALLSTASSTAAVIPASTTQSESQGKIVTLFVWIAVSVATWRSCNLQLLIPQPIDMSGVMWF